MNDATARETTPQKPTALQRVWHVTKRVLPHSINIFCIYAMYLGGVGYSEYLDLIGDHSPAARIGNVITIIIFMLFFVVMILLGVFLRNKWARRVFRYLSVPMFVAFAQIYNLLTGRSF